VPRCGQKQRKGKLRLDLRDEAVAKKAIVPGMPDESELIKRILTPDEEDLMFFSGRRKERPRFRGTEGHPETLDRRGSRIQETLAFIAAGQAPIPQSQISNPISNTIDAFVLDRLAGRTLEPAPETTRERWLRRVTLDLTGLPPTLAEMDAFLADARTRRSSRCGRLLAAGLRRAHGL